MGANDLYQACIPLRVSVETRAGPLIVPLWFEWDGASFWCASHQSAAVIAALAAEPRCAFDLSTNEMPYRGVRGRGTASRRPPGPHPDQLVNDASRSLADAKSSMNP